MKKKKIIHKTLAKNPNLNTTQLILVSLSTHISFFSKEYSVFFNSGCTWSTINVCIEFVLTPT